MGRSAMGIAVRWLVWVLLLALAFAWVGQSQGQLHLEWEDYALEATASGVLLLLLACVIGGWAAIQGVRFLLNLPGGQRRFFRRRAQERGLVALNQAFLALAKGDMSAAEKQQRNAERNLPNMALPLLLGAQIATQRRDSVRQQQLLQRMLDIPDARPLAARSLLAEALAREDIASAQLYATQALEAAPKDPDIQTLRLQLLLRQRAYSQAQDALHEWRSKRQIKKAHAARLESLLLTCEGTDLLTRRDYAGAVRLLEQATKLSPNWLPALLPLAEGYQAMQQASPLRKLVEKQWRNSPHPKLAELHQTASASVAPQAYLKQVQSITRALPDRAESLLWLASAAERMADWNLAREYAQRAVLAHPSREAYQLLARLEQRLAPQSPANSLEFRAKADIAAPLEWHCEQCSSTARQWQLDCPNCHAVDSLRWNEIPEKMQTLL